MITNNFIKEVILHIGWSKTGTSSIQSTLYEEDNNKLLLNEGFLYPRCWQTNHGVALCSAFSERPEVYASNKFPRILSKEEIRKKNKLNLEKFEKTLQGSTADKLILSAEGILPMSKKSIKDLKEYLSDIGLKRVKCRIIIYTRNPVTWTGSTLQQRFKDGYRYAPTIEKLKYQTLPTLFQDKIGKIIDIFGKKSVHIYQFEKARNHDNGMVGHFLEELNVDGKVINDLKQVRKNESMSMFTGEFLKYLNDKSPLFIKGKQNKERHKSDHEPLLRLRGDKFDLPLQDKQEIFSLIEKDIKWLKKKYKIDYFKDDIKTKKNYENLNESFQDLEDIYPLLTHNIRKYLIDFMEHKLVKEIPDNHREYCFELIQQFKNQEHDLISISRAEDRFQKRMNIYGVHKGVFFRELALLMEGYNQLDLAEQFMRRAELYIPHGPFIKRKNEEYNQELVHN